MLIYTTLYAITVFCLLLNRYKKTVYFEIIPYFCMAAVSGFRYYVGRDYKNYVMFHDLLVAGTKVKLESGYSLLVKAVDAIGGTQQLVFLIVAILTCFFYYKFIKRMSVDFNLSTMMFMCMGPYYFSSMNTIRQALAVSIVLSALCYLKNNRILYFLHVIVAAFIHKGIMIYCILPLYELMNDNHIKHFLYATVLSAVFFNVGLMERLIYHFAPSYFRYIEIYMQKMDYSYIIFLIIQLAILFTMRRVRIECSKIEICMMILSCALIIISFRTTLYSMLLVRLISMVSPVLITVVPKYEKIFTPRDGFRFPILAFCTAYYFILTSTSMDLLPYQANFALFN